VHDDPATPPTDSPPRGRWAALWADVREAVRGSDRDFTRGSLPRAIFLLAVPMVLETSMHSVFAVCDTWFVARLGPAAVAGVGLTDSLLAVVFAVSLGLSMGAAAMVARRIGEKDREGATVTTVQAIVLGLIVSVIVGVAGAANAGRLLELMGAQQDVLDAGTGYATHIFGGCGTILMLFLINAAFRGAGDPFLAMRVLALANLANVVLDPILIFGLGPIPAMGVTGAAVATNLGRGLGVLYQVRILTSGRGRIRIRRRHLQVVPETMARLLRVSAYGIFQFFVATSSFTGMVRVLTPYSSSALAGYTIAVRVIIFVLLPAWGLCNAAATLVGQNLGAGRPERAVRSVWLTARFNLGFLCSAGLLFIVAARPIVSLFTDAEDVIGYGAQCLLLVSLGYPLMAFGMVLIASFNGAGDTRTPTFINLVCHWLLKIPLAWVLTWQLGWGPTGVFVAIPVAEAVAALTAVVFFRRGHWQRKVL